jgi:hypothetical protein
MKMRVLSDLHLEFQDWNPPDVEADVIVLAGDIHSGSRGVEWARRQFPLTPILYVPGNHEFYGRDVQETLSDLGHTHDSCDYIQQGTRVVCNPRGYGPFELNAAFDPCLTVEVDRSRGSEFPCVYDRYSRFPPSPLTHNMSPLPDR